MPILSFLFGPLVGAAIGGLTNRIAIRMLFRPYTAKYIGKIHVPLTPGIIPKEKANIAKAIGSTVSDHLLNSQVLSATLLSDEMCDRLSSSVDTLKTRLLSNQESLRDFLLRYLSPDELNRLSSQIQADATHAIYLKLADKALGAFSVPSRQASSTSFAIPSSPALPTSSTRCCTTIPNRWFPTFSAPRPAACSLCPSATFAVVGTTSLTNSAQSC